MKCRQRFAVTLFTGCKVRRLAGDMPRRDDETRCS
ncbi:hypothetical protein LINPERPRIM_LOCUS9860 [Linum perenne]